MSSLDPLHTIKAQLGESAAHASSSELREARSRLGTARRAAHRALRVALETRSPDDLDAAREALQVATDAATTYDVVKIEELLQSVRGTTTDGQRARLRAAVDVTDREVEDR